MRGESPARTPFLGRNSPSLPWPFRHAVFAAFLPYIATFRHLPISRQARHVRNWDSCASAGCGMISSQALTIPVVKGLAMRVCIFEDRAEQLEPLSLTRPVFELRCGITSLAQKQVRHVGATTWSALIRPTLEDVYRQQMPGVAVNDPAALTGD